MKNNFILALSYAILLITSILFIRYKLVPQGSPLVKNQNAVEQSVSKKAPSLLFGMKNYGSQKVTPTNYQKNP